MKKGIGPMRLESLLKILPVYQSIHLEEDLHINGLKMDHRMIESGDMFICIKGFTVDGHDFAVQAVQNGACAIIAEKDLQLNVPTIIVPDTTQALALLAAKSHKFPTNKLNLIGITGTNGKTTITYLLEKIYEQYEEKTGLIGTIQVKIGNETKPIKNTTPDALTLQQIFREMVEKEVTTAIMEVSSHALDLGRVFGCDFDVAVFTNLSQDHLDYHRDMDDYLRAKTLLFTGLGNAYDDKQKFAILNKDDKHSEIIAKSTAQPIVTYGLTEQADIYAKNIRFDITHTSFDVVTPNETMHIESQLIGNFNVYNMLAAISVAYTQQIPLNIVKEALESITGVDGRFERVNAGQDYAVIVDYAHTPDSLENVLQTIKEFAERKIYVVVGTGGDRDKIKRPLMANIALKYSDFSIFTSDNPRTEDPVMILKDMTGTLTDSHYDVIENRKEAIERAVLMAQTGDIILIAGKGHETYQEINGVRHDFDDRVIARRAIEQKEI